MEISGDTPMRLGRERSCVTLGKDPAHSMLLSQTCSYHDYCLHGLLECQVLGLHSE